MKKRKANRAPNHQELYLMAVSRVSPVAGTELFRLNSRVLQDKEKNKNG